MEELRNLKRTIAAMQELDRSLAKAKNALQLLIDAHPDNDDPPCSGPGYAHKPHGRCPGYSTDRT